jgi:hypothetical protein
LAAASWQAGRYCWRTPFLDHVRFRTLPLVPVLSAIISRLPKTYYDCHVMLGGFAANFLCFVTGI